MIGISFEEANTLNALCDKIRMLNDKWWRNPATGERIERNVGEMLMLITTEIAEAMEGHRKDLMDDKLLNRKMFEVELADAMIRIFDLAGEHKLDLGNALREKCFYNMTRKDHTFEARLQQGGKKY